MQGETLHHLFTQLVRLMKVASLSCFYYKGNTNKGRKISTSSKTHTYRVNWELPSGYLAPIWYLQNLTSYNNIRLSLSASILRTGGTFL